MYSLFGEVWARAHGAAFRHQPPETKRIFVATEVVLGNPISESTDSRENELV